MPTNDEFNKFDVPFLVPDMPKHDEVSNYLKEIDQTRWYSNFGPLLARFEQGVSKVIFKNENEFDSRIVSCNSGTSALELALLQLNLSPGSKIMVPSFTFAATATAIVRAGYEPVFVDVDRQSWMLTPSLARQALKSMSVDAIIPVCALGKSYAKNDWDFFTLDTELPVIIDAASAILSQPPSAHCYTCYSLHATKIFGIGEGGLVVAPTIDKAEEIRKLSNFGFSEGMITQVGGNYKLSEYHAAIGLAQLKRWKVLGERRHRLQCLYRKHLVNNFEFFSVQDESTLLDGVAILMPSGFQSAAALVIAPALNVSGEFVTNKLLEKGVASRRWYSPGLHKHPAFSHYAVVGNDGTRKLSVTDSLNAGMVGLPYHHFLTEKMVEHIVELLVETVRFECQSLPSKRAGGYRNTDKIQ